MQESNFTPINVMTLLKDQCMSENHEAPQTSSEKIFQQQEQQQQQKQQQQQQEQQQLPRTKVRKKTQRDGFTLHDSQFRSHLVMARKGRPMW